MKDRPAMRVSRESALAGCRPKCRAAGHHPSPAACGCGSSCVVLCAVSRPFPGIEQPGPFLGSV